VFIGQLEFPAQSEMVSAHNPLGQWNGKFLGHP